MVVSAREMETFEGCLLKGRPFMKYSCFQEPFCLFIFYSGVFMQKINCFLLISAVADLVCEVLVLDQVSECMYQIKEAYNYQVIIETAGDLQAGASAHFKSSPVRNEFISCY